MSEQVENRVRIFRPTTTQEHFLRDNHTRIISFMSAINQGKSASLPAKAMYNARIQHPDVNGDRHTAAMIIRGTQAQLLDTTVKAVREWLDEELMPIRRTQPIEGFIRDMACNDQYQRFPDTMRYRDNMGRPIEAPYLIGALKDPDTGLYAGGMDVSGQLIGDVFPNGTRIQSHWRFMALDSLTWEGDLLSTNFSFALIDEADQMEDIETKLPVIDGRLGRFPSADVAPCTTAQIAMCYNPPDHGSYLEKFHRPQYQNKGRRLYRMPAPLIKVDNPDDPDDYENCDFEVNPDAEGLHFATEGAYFWLQKAEQYKGDEHYIERSLLGNYPRTSGSGRRVYTKFDARKHVRELQASRRLKLVASFDWGNCYDDQTEVMTDTGWKLFKDVDPSVDRVATIDKDTLTYEYTDIIRKVDEPHDADMIRVKGRAVDMLVTPEHRCLVSTRSKPNRLFHVTAQELYDNPGRHWHIHTKSLWEGKKFELPVSDMHPLDFMWLLGMCMTDGTVKKNGALVLTQVKQQQREQIEQVITDDWSVFDTYYYLAFDHPFSQYYAALGTLKKDRAIPSEVMNAPVEWIQAFLDGCIAGDGQVREDRSPDIYTAYRHIADQYQELIQKALWRASVKVQRGQVSTFADGRKVVSEDGYRLWIDKTTTGRVDLSGLTVTKEHYKGRRYCLSVPHQTLWVRRNGVAHWNGNTPCMCTLQWNAGLRVFDELYDDNMLSAAFIKDEAIPFLKSKYSGYDIVVTGDPTGSTITGASTESLFDLFAPDYPTVENLTNDKELRWDAVNYYLGHENGFEIDVHCERLIEGFESGYILDPQAAKRGQRKAQKHGPKGQFSHIHDALQAGALYFRGGHEYRAEAMQHSSRRTQTRKTNFLVI